MSDTIESLKAEIDSIYEELSKAGVSHGGCLDGLRQGLDVIKDMKSQIAEHEATIAALKKQIPVGDLLNGELPDKVATKIAHFISDYDFYNHSDSMELKFGGDGDNGEVLKEALVSYLSMTGSSK